MPDSETQVYAAIGRFQPLYNEMEGDLHRLWIELVDHRADGFATMMLMERLQMKQVIELFYKALKGPMTHQAEVKALLKTIEPIQDLRNKLAHGIHFEIEEEIHKLELRVKLKFFDTRFKWDQGTHAIADIASTYNEHNIYLEDVEGLLEKIKQVLVTISGLIVSIKDARRKALIEEDEYFQRMFPMLFPRESTEPL